MKTRSVVNSSKQKGFVYLAALIGALTGLLAGVNTGVVAGVLHFLAKDFHLTQLAEEMVVSAILVGGVLGTIFGGPISRHYGRKVVIVISAILFSAGAVFSALAINVDMLIAVRFAMGIALGMSSFVAPLYLSEIAPKEVRGKLIAMFQLMWTIGLLLVFVSDTLFGFIGSWRWMFGVAFFPAIIMLLGMLLLPESPRWLLLKGKKEKALKILQKILSSKEEVKEEVAAITESVKSKYSIWQVIRQPFFLKVLALGMILQIIQQFSGINTVMYYAPEIYHLAGFVSHTWQMWGTVLVGTINLVTTIFAVILVDKFGRRPILTFGLSVMIVSLIILGYTIYGHTGIVWLKMLAVVVLLTYVVGFAISLGPIAWIICAEIFPTKGRDFGVTCTTTINWTANAIVGFTFLTLIQLVGGPITFWIISGICFVSLLFILYFVPETKGVALEKIEKNLIEGKSLRRIGL